MKTKGTLVAAAVAGLFAAAAPIVALAGAGGDGKVHCAGVNDCKGKGGCKSADNACKGKNGCAGKGWMEMSAKDCAAKNGKVVK